MRRLRLIRLRLMYLAWAVALVTTALARPATGEIGSDGLLAPVDPQFPIAGSGTGGAWGPSPVNLRTLPPPSAVRSVAAPLPFVDLGLPTLPPPARLVVDDQPTIVSESELFKNEGAAQTARIPELLGSIQSATVSTSFTDWGRNDVNGASDGNFIVTLNGDSEPNLDVYSMAGTKLQSVAVHDVFCGGTNPLPICAQNNEEFADPRLIYDPLFERWAFVTIVLRRNTPQYVVQNAFAVSATSDPRGIWYRHQYPACGQFDNWDGSDQPRIGFNNQWIVITSACSAYPPPPASNGVNGAGLAVFMKANLYGGFAPVLNSTWFQFVDRFSGGNYNNPGGEASANNSRDTPTLTNVALPNNRMFLVASTVTSSGGNPIIVYSYLEGPGNAPVYYPAVTGVVVSGTLVTGAQGNAIPAVSAPGCSACMQALTNGWVHSAGVFASTGVNPYVVSTTVWGDKDIPNSTQIVSQALNANTGARRTLIAKAGIAGSGPMASEIAMPFVLPGYNQALIVYDHSRSDFYPGVRSMTWDIDNNSIVSVDTLQQGMLLPGPGTRARWVDFISAISPLPGTGSIIVGGTLAASSVTQTDQTTYWAQVTP